MSPTRRRLLSLSGTAAVALAGCSGLSDSDSESFRIKLGPSIDVEPVAEGLVSPTQFVVAPGTQRRYVVDQVGVIHRISSEGLAADAFLDFRDRVIVSPERGLLGLAFHPGFPNPPRFYLRYSAPKGPDAPADRSHTEILSEFETTSDGRSVKIDSERILLEIPQPTIFHQAGTITFGPDGYLYAALGESNQKLLAQDLQTNFKGCILRIDVDERDGGKPYGIPSDNPRVNRDGRPEYYAWGLRNPWRMSFNDGTLIVGDVGPYGYEEVNIVEKGGNYGWPYKLGAGCHDDRTSAPNSDDCGADFSELPGDDFIDPVTGFPREVDDKPIGTAVIGGYVYGRDEIPPLSGQYVFSNYTTELDRPAGRLFASPRTERTPWPVTEMTVENGPDGQLNRVVQSFGRDLQGRIYVLTTGVPDSKNRFEYQEGEVFRIVPPGTASTEIPPAPDVGE